MGVSDERIGKAGYLADADKYDDYAQRPPVVKAWKNDTDRAVFIAKPVWDGSMHARSRVLPGEYHVIDEQRGEISMDEKMFSLYYTKRAGRKPANDNAS